MAPGLDHSAGPLQALERRALRRAERSLRCLPFRRAFYDHVAQIALASEELCALPTQLANGHSSLNVERTEDDFNWLIRLGVLRREVDGQGLTERVRLTPMGRRVLELWTGEIPPANLLERLLEAGRRLRPRL